jgi:CheY-like chemotaxis protein
MTAGLSRRRPSLLLVEPQSLMRRTVASVARELGLAEIHETSSVEAASKLLAANRFDALVIDLDGAGAALELMSLLRRGGSKCETSIPIVALAEACDAHTVTRLKELEVRRVLLKPFKVKGVLDSVASLWPAPALAQ